MRHFFVTFLGTLCLWPSCPLAAQDRSPFSVLSRSVYLTVDPKVAETPLTEDLEDFFAFADSFGKKRGEVGFNIRADVDDDGDVDFSDFFVFADAFGKTAIPAQTNLVTVSGVVMDPDGNPVREAFVALSGSLMGSELGRLLRPAGLSPMWNRRPSRAQPVPTVTRSVADQQEDI